MKVWVMVKTARDEVGNASDPEVRVFLSKGTAEDEMIKDYAKEKAARYPNPEDLFSGECESDAAYLAGTDTTDVSWFIREAEVEQ